MSEIDLHKTLTWLQSRPSIKELKTAHPELWLKMEEELFFAIATNNPSRLHRLIYSNEEGYDSTNNSSNLIDHDLKKIHTLVKRQMAISAIKNYNLLTSIKNKKDKVKFNLFNGLIAQKLFFKKNFERKPVSQLLFSIIWPILWQKNYLMPLMEQKGIFCFYSKNLISCLSKIIGNRLCLEIEAGDGALSFFIKKTGTNIIATTNFNRKNKPKDDSILYLNAEEALKKISPQVVICSWPPPYNSFEEKIFHTPSVETYIVILSQHQFEGGNWSSYEQQKNFSQEKRYDLAKFVLPPEQKPLVIIFRRN